MMKDIKTLVGCAFRIYTRMFIWTFWLFVVGAIILFFNDPKAHADDWLCKSQASIERGGSLYSCGVATAPTEDAARARAFQNAQAEFASVCRATDGCAGKSFLVHPERTECDKTSDGIKCYRLVIYTPENATGGAPQGTKPYRADREKPALVAKRMTKAQVLENLGAPYQVLEYDEGAYGLAYTGPMCTFSSSLCWVTFGADDRVTRMTGIKPTYTDALK